MSDMTEGRFQTIKLRTLDLYIDVFTTMEEDIRRSRNFL